MTNKAARIVVDADACPVKQEIADTARAFSVPVLLVASYDHLLEPEPGVEIKQVDRSSQSVDLYISNLVGPGDIVVTQDFGLATVALAKRAVVLSNRGQRYTDGTIDFLMERRHEQAKTRRGGGRTKGPKAMTAEDRARFQQKLTKVLAGMQENSEP
ncbi:MAG TPA: YaiI/YqxD family protein [Paenibacillus sp.]|uniref:YaiI/YqxD family protein n=1 Tax=Paenibacillus sp. TaxID=58172 RepID=UPI0028D9081C|nr:YaiI/YqxD family protein [Paenibacillus sp.]HUC93176.1 YaiI/YqxD family protein [Paenibacillus sp.]